MGWGGVVPSNISTGKGQRLGGTGRTVTLCNVTVQHVRDPVREHGGKG
jgi:hypothetical protein